MNELPPLLRDQRKVDADHLKLLTIFHFIAAGLSFVGLLFLFGHYLFFKTLFANPAMLGNQKQGPPPEMIMTLVKWFYALIGTWFVISAVLTLMSGVWIKGRKHRTFSLVVAGINCLYVPFGTVLGIFTIIVLMRGSVREDYDAGK